MKLSKPTSPNPEHEPLLKADIEAVQRDCPALCNMVVPLGDLGNRLDAMYEFHTRHGIKAQRRSGPP